MEGIKAQNISKLETRCSELRQEIDKYTKTRLDELSQLERSLSQAIAQAKERYVAQANTKTGEIDGLLNRAKTTTQLDQLLTSARFNEKNVINAQIRKPNDQQIIDTMNKCLDPRSELNLTLQLTVGDLPLIFFDVNRKETILYDVTAKRHTNKTFSRLPPHYTFGNWSWMSCWMLSPTEVFMCGDAHSQTTWIYNFDNDKYTQKADMNFPRDTHGLVRVEEDMFVFGAQKEESWLTAERYNFAQDKWTNLSNMPVPMSYVSCTTINSDVFIVSKTCENMLQYYTKTDKYSQINIGSEENVFKRIVWSQSNLFIITNDATITISSSNTGSGSRKENANDSPSHRFYYQLKGQPVQQGELLYFISVAGVVYSFNPSNQELKEVDDMKQHRLRDAE